MPNDDERLVVAIEARLADFERGLKAADRRMKRFEKNVSGSMKGAERASKRTGRAIEKDISQAARKAEMSVSRLEQRLTGLARGAAIGAGAFVSAAAIQQVNDAAASIADLRAEADRAGVSFQDFQRLKFASEQQRVSIDALTDGMKELNLRADEFIATGKGSAAEAFDRLGFSAQTLAQRLNDPAELLVEILRRVEAFDRAAQIRIFDELFGGTGGEQFVQLLRNGADGFVDSMRDAATFSDDIADKAAETDAAFKALVQTIDVNLKEAIVGITAEIGNWITAAQSFAQQLSAALDDFGTRLGNADIFRQFNEAVAGAGLSSTPSDQILDPVLRRAQAIQELQDEEARLTVRLERQQQALELNERLYGGSKVGEYTEEIEALRDRLAEVQRQMELVNEAGVRLSTPFPNDAPPGIGMSGSDPRVSNAQAYLGGRLAKGTEDIANLKQAAAAGAAAVLSMPQFQGVRVQSAYRSPAYNRSVGGADDSRHMYGDAVDFSGVPENALAMFVKALQSQGFTSFGYYGGGNLHADMRPNPTWWGPNRSSTSLDQTPASFQELARLSGTGQSGMPGSTGGGRKEKITDAERHAEAIARVNRELQQELELAGMQAELAESGLFTAEEVNAAVEQEALVRQKLNELERAGVEVSAEMEQAIRSKVAALFELREASDAAVAAEERLIDSSQQATSGLQGFGQPILDTLFGIVDGSEDAEEAVKNLAKQLANMVLQAALFGQGPLGGFFGGGLLGGLFGGARAAGGPVSAGKAYRVGEHGEEMFVPNQPGHIINAATVRQMARQAGQAGETMGSTTVHVVSRFDADGNFQTAVERVSRPIARQEGRGAAGALANRIPAMVDQRTDDRELRRPVGAFV